MPTVVRRDSWDSGSRSVIPEELPDNLLGEHRAMHPICPINRLEDVSAREASLNEGVTKLTTATGASLTISEVLVTDGRGRH